MRLALATGLGFVSCLVFAGEVETVYRSVDENGVVTFSDMPPAADPGADTLTIEVSTPAVDGEYQQRLQDMRETTDRMAADRREREKHRAELREIAARTAAHEAAAQEPPYAATDPYWGWSGSTRVVHPPSVLPPFRPGLPTYPVHPIAPHPGPIPVPYPMRNNSQLMRPILPR